MTQKSKNLLNTNGLLTYKGYLGSLNFSTEDKILYGKVLGLDSVSISYEGKSFEELQNDFHDGVDHYLNCCKADGEEPLSTDLEIVKKEVDSEYHKLSEKISYLEQQEYLSDDSMVLVNQNY